MLLHNKELQHLRGTKLFFSIFFSFYFVHNTSGAAPQQGVAAPDGAPDFLLFQNHLFEFI
jgi:hypothetical protein